MARIDCSPVSGDSVCVGGRRITGQKAIDHVRGWILDVYPSEQGEITVWIITETGERIKLTDRFQPKIYVSGEQEEIERLISRLHDSQSIAQWNFTSKYAQPTDTDKSRVLEITLKDCRKTQSLTTSILRLGDYLRFEVHNCDLKGDRAYLFSHDIFPLAFVETIPPIDAMVALPGSGGKKWVGARALFNV